MKFSFHVPGVPISKARHHTVAMKRCSCGKQTAGNRCRFCGSTDLRFIANVGVADKPTENYEAFVALCCMNAGIRHKTYCGPVTLNARFYFKAAKSNIMPEGSRSKSNRWIRDGQPHTQKPDLDNCLKSLLDGMSRGSAWNDDDQVIEIVARKSWTHGEPGVDVEIEYLELEDAALPLKMGAEGEHLAGVSQTRSPFQD